MAEDVGRNTFLDAGSPCRLLQNREDHHSGQCLAPIVEKEGVVIATLVVLAALAALAAPVALATLYVGVFGTSAFEILRYAVAGCRTDWDEALLVAFADDTDIPLSEEEVTESQRGELRDTQSARVERLEHRTVALALGV